MQSFVDALFKHANPADKRKILTTLKDLGIDAPEDLRHIRESDVSGKLKPIHVRKLMEAVKLVVNDNHPQAPEPPSDPPPTYSDTCPDTCPDTFPDKTTKSLAIATGVLGSVGAAAVPLAIFAALFPPITLPIAIAAGIGAGAVSVAAASTGIATAVKINMKPTPASGETEEASAALYKKQNL